jgi:hypothetical protein
MSPNRTFEPFLIPQGELLGDVGVLVDPVADLSRALHQRPGRQTEVDQAAVATGSGVPTRNEDMLSLFCGVNGCMIT